MSGRGNYQEDRLGGYVEVKDRIRLFYERHPDGRLVTTRVKVSAKPDGVPRVWVSASAFRDPEDTHPGIGTSWMVLPGSTPYTRGSELENTETSAWGRAIGALGIGIDKSIATGDEVRVKAGEEARSIATAPMTHTDDGGLIGEVTVGKPPVDMELRQTPDGPAWGFKLTSGGKGYQALALGSLAEALSVAGLKAKDRVIVWGRIDMIPWDKDGKSMPPYARVAIERVSTSDWDLPADEPAAEAPSEPMFALTDEEKVAVAGGVA